MPIIITARPATFRKMIRRVRLDMLRCVKNRQAARINPLRGSLSSRAQVVVVRWRGRLDLGSQRFGRFVEHDQSAG